MALLEVKNIKKSFDGVETLRGVGFGLDAGGILSLLGPSGCGKTTLLRIIAGLEFADSGRVLFNAKDISGVPPHKRRFGMMFQEFALFPHKNVFENVSFGLEMQRLSQDQINDRANSVLELVGLKEFSTRKVGELSGGERQRVALARSLAPQPDLLMLDEPLGALDRALRERLMVDIRGILKKLGVTAVFVTHDQAEAFAVADLIAVMHDGRIEQINRPEELFRAPATPQAAKFLGFRNIFKGLVLHDGLHFDNNVFPLPKSGEVGVEQQFVIKPDFSRLINRDEKPAENEFVLNGTVTERLFQGRNYHIGIATGAARMHFNIPNWPEPPRTGEPISLAVHDSSILLFEN